MPPVLNQPADRYRRNARRIRGRHGGNPGELYRSLRELSDRYDSTYPDSADPTASIRPESPAEDFTSQIVERIQSGVLSYSDRLELLEEAEKSGIGRFDANLIIAAVQHRCASRPMVSVGPRVKPKIRVLDLVGAVLAVQGLIVFLGWLVFLR